MLQAVCAHNSQQIIIYYSHAPKHRGRYKPALQWLAQLAVPWHPLHLRSSPPVERRLCAWSWSAALGACLKVPPAAALGAVACPDLALVSVPKVAGQSPALEAAA